MQSPASNNPPNRRQIVRGAAWSAPAVLSAGVVPAYASSKKGTATTTAGQYFRTVTRKAMTGACNVTSNPIRGYIDSLPYKSPGGNSNTNRDPATSNGYWVEGSAGTVTNVTIKSVVTFNHPIQIEPTGSLGANVVPAGWTVTQTDSKTLTMTFSVASWNVSTSVAGTGDATGVFIQFKVTDACLAARALTVTGQTTMTYTDAVGTKTMTKNTGPTSM